MKALKINELFPKNKNRIMKKLSVVICTYNRDKYIYNVLKSIAVNNFPADLYEIIVINNNSTDSTEKEYERFCSDFQHINCHYFIEKNQGLSHARNRGIKESSGEIIIYVDDDATVNQEYLQSYYDFFEKHEYAMAAGGSVIPVYETEKPKWMSYYTERLVSCYFYKGEKIKLFTRGFPCGGNAAYRSKIFADIGLFNIDLGRNGTNLIGAEEKDIFDKMRSRKLKFYYLPNAVLYHIIPQTKLTKEYFKNLTLSIGKSERIRTLSISKWKYTKKIVSELIKWIVSVFLYLKYILILSPQKGWKLLVFRWYVAKGLIEKK
jgi:glycosyltransferase involved in cell wall biosynthesis